MAKHICIIGGSGFVGHAVTHAARVQGHHVTVACRHPERARNILTAGARLSRVDITDGSGLAEAVSGSDCVINLVGLLFEKGRYSFEATHVQGTSHVLKACKDLGIKQYIHMSALGANQGSESAYARTKAMAEDKVHNCDLRWTIFRPSIIYGAGDSFFNTFKQLSRIPPMLPVISGATRFQPVWVKDVARSFIQCITNRHSYGKTFELGGPETYSFQELLELLMKTLSRRRLLLPVPQPLARLMATVMQFLPTPPLTPDQLILLQHDNVIDGAPFPKMFGSPARLEEILPTYIGGTQVSQLQQSMDHYRKHYWNA
ncbi:MAG: complex I NDUFA9 subunit family protein [Mariprofundaceae bacterium]